MLSKQHRRMLVEESAIAPAVIEARGYRSVTAQEAKAFGFSGRQARSGLLIPVHTTNGQLALHALRPDDPRVVVDKRRKKDPKTGQRPPKVIKYEWPRGAEPRVDCPPSCYDRLKDAKTPLWITEGQKKGDALASWGLCAIDLPGGVWGWKSKKNGILADLDYIVWVEREVYIIFDADVMTKRNVSLALARLTKILSRRGAKVSPVPLPQQGDNKLGVDDFKAQGGTLEQLRSFAHMGRLLPLKTEDRPGREAESAEYIRALKGMGYRFTMNAIDDTVEVNGKPISDPLRAEIRTRMRDAGYRHVNVIEDAYTAHAFHNLHHPVQDFLTGLQWDKGDHISKLARFFQDDHAEVYQQIAGTEGYVGHMVFYLWLRRWLIGAVGKALEARQSLMITIDGPQGSGKSFFVQWLGGVLPDYFIEAPVNPDDKDCWARLMSKLVWEVGELGASTRRTDREALKNFISTRTVVVRKPYGKYDTIKPAMASLIGTINNESGFLTDPTGNRRFLICRLTGIDWAYTTQVDRKQLWAEAVALYRQGEAGLPTPQEIKLQTAINEEYMVEKPLETLLYKYYEINPALTELWTPGMEIVTKLESYGLRGSQRENLRELSALMKSLGVTKGRPRILPGRPVSYQGIYEKNR